MAICNRIWEIVHNLMWLPTQFTWLFFFTMGSLIVCCRYSWGRSGLFGHHTMTSSDGNIFRVTGHLCGEFTGPRWILHTKASDAEFDVSFDRRLNKRLSKQSWGWWFETLSCPLWRHYNKSINDTAACFVGLQLALQVLDRIIADTTAADSTDILVRFLEDIKASTGDQEFVFFVLIWSPLIFMALGLDKNPLGCPRWARGH